MGTCRSCARPIGRVFADLGVSPLANDLITPDRVDQREPAYPLRALVCDACFLVQVEDVATRERIFSPGYTYHSSYSSSWLEHCRRFADAMVERFGISAGQRVVEVASNDGYLLQYFQRRGLLLLGIEPATVVAEVARERGVPTLERFFGLALAEDLAAEGQADLLVANNVLPHVPDPNDFVAGLARLLAPDGVLTLELQHLLPLIEGCLFETIYHEHFSYFWFTTARELLAAHGLAVFDVEELPTHGGSLRIYARHGHRDVAPTVRALGDREAAAGYDDPARYDRFQAKVLATREAIAGYFHAAREDGRTVVGYGAPAKGTTLLNACQIDHRSMAFTVDRNPAKQGTLLPGARIPVRAPEALDTARPDDVFILPWNLRREIIEQLGHIRQWGGRFVVRTPELTIIP